MDPNSKQLLKQLILEVIETEAAIPIEQAEKSKLALYKYMENGVTRDYHLYSPMVFEQELINTDLLNEPHWKIPQEKKDRIFYAYISIVANKECKFWEVTISAATKGYGPLIYKIAMSDIYPDSLASDRANVSEDAFRLWMQMATRDEYVPHEISRNLCTFKNMDKDRVGTEYLQYSYSIKQPLNTQGLVKAHKSFAKKHEPEFGPAIEELLQSYGPKYFERKHRGVIK